MLDPRFLDAPIAHRALHDGNVAIAENSWEAIDLAISHGYGIEIDIQLSADEVAMVFHDYVLDRLTTDSGATRSKTSEELAETTFKTGQQGIPTLRTVAEHVDGRVPLLIEVKDQHGTMGDTDGLLEQAVATALHGLDGPFALMSFNPFTVAKFKSLCPNIPRGLTTCSFNPSYWAHLPAPVRETLAGIPDYDRTGACFISHDRRDLGDARVAELKENGAHILCWTVRSQAEDTLARRVAGNITFEGFSPQGAS